MRTPIFLLLLVLTGFLSAQEIAPFQINEGQWPDEIRFRASNQAANVYLMENALSFCLAEEIEYHDPVTGEEKEEYQYRVWNLKMAPSSLPANIQAEGEVQLPIHYLFGSDSSKWVRYATSYQQVHYQDIYPSTDLEFYLVDGRLKYDWKLFPGSDLSAMELTYEGADSLYIDREGNLNVVVGEHIWQEPAPESFFIHNGKTDRVEITYRMLGNNTYGYETQAPISEEDTLVIDPFILVYGTYGGATGVSNNRNYSYASAMDNQGNLYITGQVDGTYPTTPGVYGGSGAITPDVFVTKFSADGSQMVYSTYIGGSSEEHGIDITVDQSGRAGVVGFAYQSSFVTSNFPTTANAYQPSHNGNGADAFLSVLNSTGTSLAYSTFLGGNGCSDYAMAVQAGTGDHIFVGGWSQCTDFPVKNAYQSSLASVSSRDGFVAGFDTGLSGNSSLTYATYLGGTSIEDIFDITVNSANEAAVAGRSASSNFPVSAGVYQTTYNGGSDGASGILARFNASGGLIFSTFTGPGSNLAVDYGPGNSLYIGGSTATFLWPVTSGVIQPLHGQDPFGSFNTDGLIAAFNPLGTTLQFATFLGGEENDSVHGIAVNSQGHIYVSGMTRGSFPVTIDAFQPAPGSPFSEDYFLTHLLPGVNAYGCGGSTYVGGNSSDYRGTFYNYPTPRLNLWENGSDPDTVAFSGTSHSTDFPTSTGAYQPNKINSSADQPVAIKFAVCDILLRTGLELTTVSNQDRVNLQWSHRSGDKFEGTYRVERSLNGQPFIVIGEISTLGNNRTFTDIRPPSGRLLYRIQLNSSDGLSEFSNVTEELFMSDPEIWNISPNPARQSFEVQNIAGKQIHEVRLMDASGHLVIQQNFSDMKTHKTTLNIEHLPAGLYHLAIYSSGRIYYHKIIKE